jgi:hypothetical protein
MKKFVALLCGLSALVVQGCATTGADLGAFRPAPNLVAVQKSIEKTAQTYMSLADRQQDRLDDSYSRNFLLSAIAAGGAISSLHVSAVKGLAFASGSSALYSEQSPNGKRAEALLAGAATLQCMLQKTHEAGYGLPTDTPAGKVDNTTAATSPPQQLGQTQKSIADRILLHASSRVAAREPTRNLDSTNLTSRLNLGAQALASKIDTEINPVATDAAVTAALNDGAEFVERQIRERFLNNSKFDYKKIFADLKALSEASTQKDQTAEAEAAMNDLPSGSGKVARIAAKSDPRRTVLKDIMSCRERLL